MVVLGLAAAHHEETKNWMQVRGVDQTPYPSQLHGASLATAMQRPCRPLQTCDRLGTFYICTDVSHTPCHSRVYFPEEADAADLWYK